MAGEQWEAGTVTVAQELTGLESRVKAAFLYNFAKLVEWPTNAFPSAHAPLVIGLFGQDSLGTILNDTVKGKKIGDHSITVQRLHQSADGHHCHMLFISASEINQIPVILAAVRGRNVLTVGETAEFMSQGGMIQFVKQQQEIRFAINTNATRQAGLTPSSKLLRLAINLRENRAGGTP